MLIAVIGDYLSPNYKTLLENVKRLKPDEQILDLSRHHHVTWKREKDERYKDIENADEVVIGADWPRHFDAKLDITYAQSKYKDCYVEYEGRFLPFPDGVRGEK
jgi:hypothetical protein